MLTIMCLGILDGDLLDFDSCVRKNAVWHGLVALSVSCSLFDDGAGPRRRLGDGPVRRPAATTITVTRSFFFGRPPSSASPTSQATPTSSPDDDARVQRRRHRRRLESSNQASSVCCVIPCLHSPLNSAGESYVLLLIVHCDIGGGKGKAKRTRKQKPNILSEAVLAVSHRRWRP